MNILSLFAIMAVKEPQIFKGEDEGTEQICNLNWNLFIKFGQAQMNFPEELNMLSSCGNQCSNEINYQRAALIYYTIILFTQSYSMRLLKR